MKNKTKFIFISAAIMMIMLCGTSSAQFRLAAGGPLSDESHSHVQTSDGGFVVAGNTQSYGIPGKNAYVIKFNNNGAIQWSKAIGGAVTDAAYTIIKTSDGGYALTGWTNSYGAGNYDMYVVKLDASGSMQWNKVIGGAADDYGSSIIQAVDGGFVVAGRTKSFGAGNDDILLVKLSTSGVIQWCRTAGGTGNDVSYALIRTSDGGYAAAGSTTSFGAGSTDMYVIKFNSNGIPEWSRTCGGTGVDAALSIIQSSDGSYVLAGSTMSYGAGNYDMYIVKISSTGSLTWTRTLGASTYEFASSVVQTTDGGYIVAGSTESFGAGMSDIYLVKLNSGGSVQWQKTSGGAGDEYGYSVVQTTDGGYCVAGYTESYGTGNADIFMLKFSSNGSICGSSNTPTGSSGSGGTAGSILPVSFPYSPTVTTPSPVVLTGGSVSTVCLTGIETVSSEIPETYSLSQNYPNPFNPVTNIKFSIPDAGIVSLAVYDLSGREVSVLVYGNLSAGSYTVDLDASNLSSGVYLYRITISGSSATPDIMFTETKKMMLVK